MGASMFKKLPESPASTLTLFIDGKPVAAAEGESVAAVLLRQESLASRTTPVLGTPRAPYCMMGVCFDCLAVIDGVASTQSCLVTVQEGMQVERQYGRRSVTA
ncbi:Hydrogen cyanide synthase subunit HcnA [compost metagenome]